MELVELVELEKLEKLERLEKYKMEEENRDREAAASTQFRRKTPGEEFVCCGQHAVCERELLMKAAGEPIDYFDDEELDRFRGRQADAYTMDEEEEFREVLYTTLTHEVPDWLRSLQLRGIELPEGLRDEALLLAQDNKEGS